MPVFKAPARLHAPDGALLGEGRAYIHLRASPQEAQPASGTLSLDWWDDEAGTPARLDIAGGPSLVLAVNTDRLSGCLVGRILRYTTHWPGASPPSVERASG